MHRGGGVSKVKYESFEARYFRAVIYLSELPLRGERDRGTRDQVHVWL